MLLALVACGRMLQGEIRDPAGAPVAGARLTAPGCEAVSAADGRWRCRCPRAPQRFVVSRPGFETAELREGGPLVLLPYPQEPGFYHRDGAWSPLPEVALRRSEEAREIRWCSPESGPSLRGPVLDVHAVEWRAFRLDEEGCAWRLRQGTGSYWSGAGLALPEPLRSAVSPGTDRIEWQLEPGSYAIVEWLDGAPAPRAPGEGRAWLFVVD